MEKQIAVVYKPATVILLAVTDPKSGYAFYCLAEYEGEAEST